jgi:predicted transglutaminase-like cysteine proteinase
MGLKAEHWHAKGMTLLWVGLLLLALWIPSPAAAADSLWPPSRKIFSTMDFKSKLQGVPQWIRVMERGEKEINLLSTCQPGSSGCPRAAGPWQQLATEVKNKPVLEQLKAVTKFFNTWPYRLDRDNYGKDDYWAAPLEFVKNSGDCEDYSIIKYYALRRLGVDPNNMRIVALQDTILRLGHAILAVYADGKVYVLDNQTSGVFEDSRYPQYVPQYSVNEFFKWAHVPQNQNQNRNSGSRSGGTPRR